MIFNLVGSVLFFTVFSGWLFFSLLLSLAGALLPISSKKLKSEDVKTSDTICRALFEKGKLTEAEYAFETNKVAESYDDLVFRGYGFIMFPVIWTLKRCDVIDSPLLFLAHRWMSVHHYFFDSDTQNTPSKFDIAFTKLCVSIAKGTGKTLSLFL